LLLPTVSQIYCCGPTPYDWSQMKLSSIDFASPESYHEIQIKNIDLSEAEGVLAEERKKYLRTAAKEKSGQAPGVGALSTAAKGIYSIMAKQAVRTHLGVSRLTTRNARRFTVLHIPLMLWCCHRP